MHTTSDPGIFGMIAIVSCPSVMGARIQRRLCPCARDIVQHNLSRALSKMSIGVRCTTGKSHCPADY